MSTRVSYSGPSLGYLETIFLKLDASNDPVTGDLLFTPDSNSTSTFLIEQSDGTDVFTIDTTNRKIIVSSGTTGQSLFDAGVVINNSGDSAAINDFTVKTDNYNAIHVDASNDDITLMNNTSGKLAFFAATPSVQNTGWSVTNVTTDKVYDADATTTNELADVLGTLIDELKSKGFLGA